MPGAHFFFFFSPPHRGIPEKRKVTSSEVAVNASAVVQYSGFYFIQCGTLNEMLIISLLPRGHI